MRIVCISDTHTKHKDLGILPDGDVLVHTGDWTYRGGRGEIRDFLEWFDAQPHKHKVFIAGNHEFTLDRDHEKYDAALRAMVTNSTAAMYLENSGVEIEGVKFWGSPYSNAFGRWGFSIPDDDYRRPLFFTDIPADTEVLLTHGPAQGILDTVHDGEHLGSQELANTITMGLPLRAHIFGHIHDSYGYVCDYSGRAFVNAAMCDEAYKCVNKPIVIDV